jgi:Mg2+-importing ATPase
MKKAKEKLGISEEEAKEKLEKFGPNIFWKKRGFDWWRFTREQVFNLFNTILLFVFLISFFGGERKIESLLIFFFFLISILVSFFSELNYHRLLLKLEKFLQKKVLVVRDGKRKYVLAENLVPGDVIYLSKGEKVPADCKILKSFNAFFNEQVLTGESELVQKKEGDLIFAGTEISEGEVEAEVLFTGSQTKFSKIGKLAIETLKKSAYQQELETFTKGLVKIVAVFFIALFLFHYFFRPFEFKEILAFCLILGISIIPELLPPISVLTLVFFSNQFAKRGTFIKRLTAIEDLGVIDVLCVDKTGTLTTNELKLVKIDSPNPDKFLTFALSLGFGVSQKYLSDFEEALEKAVKPEIKEKLKEIKLIDRRLFDPQKRISQAILEVENKKFLVIVGAPENVLNFSKFEKENEKELWLKKLKEYSENGYRVYSLAFKEILKEKFLNGDSDLYFLGMAIFEDEIKESAKPALLEAEKLGIDVKILSGDRPEVVKRVALEIGLIDKEEKVFTEEELLKMEEKEFEEVVEKFNAFARVTPETKFKIVKALQKKYKVGYLGEGINDLPVIKLAQIGLVVDSAVDAAKEIADIVLLHKDLKVILDGIVFGRRAFFNIIKFLRHTMSDNFGNFFSIGILSFFLPFFPLTPLQILLTDFLTDFPALALSTDYVLEREIKKPLHYRTKEMFSLLVALGLVSAIFIAFALLLFKNQSPQFLQTIIFLQTTISGILVFYSIRTNDWFFKSKPSPFMNLTVFLSLILTLIVLISPFSSWFGFAKLPPNVILFFFFFNLLFVFANDIVKKLVLQRFKNELKNF